MTGSWCLERLPCLTLFHTYTHLGMEINIWSWLIANLVNNVPNAVCKVCHHHEESSLVGRVLLPH